MMETLQQQLASKIPLHFHKDGTFKIAMMSDLHWSTKRDQRTLKAIRIILNSEKPDFVIFGGDVVTDTPNEEDFKSLLKEIAEPMETLGIPWSHVYGNHDAPTGIPKVVQQHYYEQLPHCLSKAGSSNLTGVGNYLLPILSSQNDHTVFAIWALDSHQTFRDTVDLPNEKNPTYNILMPTRIGGRSDEDFIRFDQLMWYWNTSQALEQANGAKVPGIMYFHIPLYEFNAILNNALRTGMTGEYNEAMCTSEVNSGLFAVIVQRGDVRGVYCGHDHINTFDGEYCGIRMGYDGCIGYSTYGTRPNDPSPDKHRLRGARIFELNEACPQQFKTRMVFVSELNGGTPID